VAAVAALLGVRSNQELLSWLDRHDPRQRAAVSQLLEQRASDRYGGLSYLPWLELSSGAEVDPREAWKKIEAEREVAEGFDEALRPEYEAINAALEEGDVEKTIDICEAAIARARAARATGSLAYLQNLRGSALQLRTSGSRAENIEAAIDALSEAVAYAPPGSPALETRRALALTWSECESGDWVANLAVCSEILREAVQLSEGTDLDDLRAQLKADLARSLMRREDGDRRSHLEEGVSLAREAVTELEAGGASPQLARARFAVAGLQVNLARLERTSTADGERLFMEVAKWAEEAGDLQLAAGAMYELGKIKRTAAANSQERIERSIENNSWDEEERKALQLREEALEHLRAAAKFIEGQEGSLESAQVLGELCLVLGELGYDQEAIDAGEKALEVLSPTRLTRPSFEVTSGLAAVYATRGEWAKAVAIYRLAIAAGEIIFQSLRDDDRRQAEILNLGELGRWAALALAMIGETEEAATVLENAQARELRRRLGPGMGDSGRLGDLPTELREEYTSALSALAGAPLRGSSAEGRRYQDVLARIRVEPGFSDFARGGQLSDLRSATEQGWPLLYVNPTPVGTLLLLVEGDTVTSKFLSTPTSHLIAVRLIVGSSYVEGHPIPNPPGPCYSMAIIGNAELPAALDDTLAWVGSELAKPIDELLSKAGASGVALVLCGPLGAVPLAVASWSGPGAPQSLLDNYEIRYAPSGSLVQSSLQRAETSSKETPFLVGLANPERDLEAAEPELREISRLFGKQVELAFEDEATSAFLRDNAPKATHLHLACHGGGGIYDLDSIVVYLADRPLQAIEISGPLKARVAVISACQTAVPLIAGPASEVFSTSTAFLAAGSACVLASLWPVNDLATALLMTKFYEELFIADLRPPEALRRAQLWLRELPRADARTFLNAHPKLRADAERREREGEQIDSKSRGTAWLSPGRPFSHPTFWAPFIAIGV
jgi:CHAT domain-containing protein/tetratricopeptide (TPR) repeat protein